MLTFILLTICDRNVMQIFIMVVILFAGCTPAITPQDPAETSVDAATSTLRTGTATATSGTTGTTGTTGTSSDSSLSSEATGSPHETSSGGGGLIPWTVPLDKISELGLGFILEGPSEDARLGYNIVPVQDWNDDGVGDLVVLAPGADHELGVTVFGGDFQEVIDLKNVRTMKQGTTIVGDGYAVRPLGDVNGDGIDDLGLEDRSFNTDPDDYYEGRVYAAWGQVQKELNFLTAFEKRMGSQVTGHIQGQGLGPIAGVGRSNTQA